jgi:hypothetical protein
MKTFVEQTRSMEARIARSGGAISEGVLWCAR